MARVTVNEGILEGELVENEYGGSYYSFKGVPYAEPPVGRLRFKAPQPPIPWEGVRCAKEFGNVSYQPNQKGDFRGDEDCLYLNVYTPSIKPTARLPVMLWIHGGSFESGSGNDYLYAPEFLVRHDVIFITFNYRLGALGFLSLHTKEIPGNAGLKDQVAALKWVKKNIHNFGGNPDNVTIFGNSAGAACVCLHLVSPMTKGLYKRAIAISGCSYSWWAHTMNPLEKAQALAKSLGCYSEDVEELSKIFRELPAKALVDVDLPPTIMNNASRTNVFANIPFAVVSELTFDDTEAYFQGNVFDFESNDMHQGVEVLIGYNADEGVIVVPKTKEYDDFARDINANRELLIPTPIYKNCLPNQQLQVAMEMKRYYLGTDRLTRENWEQLSKYFGLETFVYDITQWLQCYCANTVYFYKFSCMSERNIMASRHGLFSSTRNKDVVTHADELGYIFNAKVIDKVDKQSPTYQMIGNMTTLFTNFAKYGNPTPDKSLGVTWLPYTLEEQDYLDIGNHLTPKRQPDSNELRFWQNVYRKYYSLYSYKPKVQYRTLCDKSDEEKHRIFWTDSCSDKNRFIIFLQRQNSNIL